MHAPEIVGVRLTQAAYAHGSALGLPQEVEMARPTGVERALAPCDVPIEGRDEWLAAARRPAGGRGTCAAVGGGTVSVCIVPP
jgi:hypothetical protein